MFLIKTQAILIFYFQIYLDCLLSLKTCKKKFFIKVNNFLIVSFFHSRTNFFKKKHLIVCLLKIDNMSAIFPIQSLMTFLMFFVLLVIALAEDSSKTF